MPPRKRSKDAPAARPELIPQPHGGALLSGGVKGHAPPPGRPASAVRDELRAMVTGDRLARFGRIMDGEAVVRMRTPDGKETDTLVSPSLADQARVLDVVLKYGLGTVRELTVDFVRDRLTETVDLLEHALPPDVWADVGPKLQKIWNR